MLELFLLDIFVDMWSLFLANWYLKKKLVFENALSHLHCWHGVDWKRKLPKISRKIKHTLIFNNLWDGICEGGKDNRQRKNDNRQGDNHNRPTIPTSYKECAIRNNKDKKTYVVITAIVSKEVSHHIVSINDSYGALKKLMNLYDSHSKMEPIQLLVLFNLKLKNDDPMALAYEIKAIMHGIDAIGVMIDIFLTTFIRALYPTYSHYLESLQAIGHKKSITFDVEILVPWKVVLLCLWVFKHKGRDYYLYTFTLCYNFTLTLET